MMLSHLGVVHREVSIVLLSFVVEGSSIGNHSRPSTPFAPPGLSPKTFKNKTGWNVVIVVIRLNPLLCNSIDGLIILGTSLLKIPGW